jgi:hypothetical protein
MIRTVTRTRVLWLGMALAFGLVPLGACEATVGVKGVSIPKDAAQTCAGHCQTIGMRLTAVAIMAENVGCVCQSASEPQASADKAGQLSTPAAGMATIAAQQAAAAAAAQASQRRPQAGHY